MLRVHLLISLSLVGNKTNGKVNRVPPNANQTAEVTVMYGIKEEEERNNWRMQVPCLTWF